MERELRTLFEIGLQEEAHLEAQLAAKKSANEILKKLLNPSPTKRKNLDRKAHVRARAQAHFERFNRQA